MNVFEYPLEPRDYWRIITRHKMAFLLPFVLVAGLASTAAFVLPPIFKSEATFMIQRQTIPENLVTTTVTGYIQEQIQQIRTRITTYDNLVRLADTNNLYPAELADDPNSVVEKLRERINVEMEDVQATDPTSGGIRTATVSFKISVEAEAALTAQALTSQLSQRFLSEHREAREERAEKVTEFFADEAEQLQLEIANYEERLAEFKKNELEQLPELLQMNLNLHERTQRDIDQTKERILILEQQVNTTRAELSLTEPYKQVVTEDGNTLLTGEQRLSALTAQYLQALSRYSAEHPDVKRLSREIRILSEQQGGNGRLDEIMARLVSLQEQLRQARQRYTDTHPEVQQLETTIASVRRGLKSAAIDQEETTEEIPPDNPRYVALQNELRGHEANLRAERNNLGDLNEKLADYEERLKTTPIVQSEYQKIARGYDNAKIKFNELKNKQIDARISQELEGGDSAEQFVLASSAFLPRLPESPNRVGIILLGLFFGMLSGLAMVVLFEHLDKTVRNARMIYNVVGVQPLATIPEFNT